LVAGRGGSDVDRERTARERHGGDRYLSWRDDGDRRFDRAVAAVRAVATLVIVLGVEHGLELALVRHDESAVGERDRAPRDRGDRVDGAGLARATAATATGADRAAAAPTKAGEPLHGRRHGAADDGALGVERE